MSETRKRSDILKKSSAALRKKTSKSNTKSWSYEASKSLSRKPLTPKQSKKEKSANKKSKKIKEEKKSFRKASKSKSVPKKQRIKPKTPVRSKKDKRTLSNIGRPTTIPQKSESKHIRKPIRKDPTSTGGIGSLENENNFMVCSKWSQAVASKKEANRMILIMRSAERVDRVFGSDWFSTEAPHGVLTPTDLNVPNNVTTSQLLNSGALIDNPPITTIGKYSTVLVARAIHNRGIMAKMVVCSPTLRAIQTGGELAKILKAEIAIEPGLVEPLAWYRRPDKETLDFRLDEIGKHYVFDTKNYNRIISIESIMKLYAIETESQGLSRIEFVLRRLASEQRKDPLIVVGHAITQAVATAFAYPSSHASGTSSQTTSFDLQTTGHLLDRDALDPVNLGLRFPPGSVVALTQINKGPQFFYELVPNVVPPLSYGEIYSNEPVLEI